MIGRLYGIILERTPPNLLLDVNGVGYEISASMHTFYQLPNSDQPITLYTHLVTREDAQLLYGFHSIQERALFRELIKVSGVGPKLALTMLSSIQPEQFILCINTQDALSLVKVPGIGKRTAERLIIEMRDRLADIPGTDVRVADQNKADDVQDAISALVALGYKAQDAARIISKLPKEGQGGEQLIRAALQQLVK